MFTDSSNILTEVLVSDKPVGVVTCHLDGDTESYTVVPNSECVLTHQGVSFPHPSIYFFYLLPIKEKEVRE